MSSNNRKSNPLKEQVKEPISYIQKHLKKAWETDNINRSVSRLVQTVRSHDFKLLQAVVTAFLGKYQYGQYTWPDNFILLAYICDPYA